VEVERKFWWRTAGIVVGLGVLGVVGFLIFNRLAYRFGMVAAFIIVFLILMAVAYRSDRKKQREYDTAS
jgi:cbb3-type cytochrome oxidase subunit 3